MRKCALALMGAMSAVGMNWGVVRGAEKLPFTVSVETTGIVSPLHEDGTPDYVEALNEREGKGVRAEENAYTAWLEAVGPGAESAAIMTPVYHRAAPHKMAALAGARVSGKTGWHSNAEFLREQKFTDVERSAFEDQLYQSYFHAWTGKDFPAVAVYLKEHGDFLDLMEKVWARPQCWIPSVAEDGRSMVILAWPEVGQVAATSNELLSRANLRMASGDFAGFMRDLHAMILMANARVLGAWGEGNANEAIGLAAGSGMLSKEQCDRILEELHGRVHVHRAAEILDVKDRWTTLDLEVLIATGKLGTLKAGIASDFYQRNFEKFEKIDPAAVDWDTVMRTTNQTYDLAVNALKIENLQEMREASRLVWRQFKPGKNAMEMDLTKMDGETQEDYTTRVTKEILRNNLDGFESQEVSERQQAMWNAMTETLLAAAKCKAEKGQWPESLDELVPAYLKEVPVDIFSPGEADAVRWWHDSKGARVYSVGQNGRDDGGVNDEATKKDDIAVGVGGR